MNEELERLENIASASHYAAGINTATTRYSFRVFARHLRGRSVLEMGAAEGVMTELLAQTGLQLTIVEGSSRFCRSLAQRFPAARVVHAIFESYVPRQRFDNIVLGHVLEHVEDARAIVARATRWLEPGGRMLAAVPNARSLHRQAAVLMRLLPTEHSMSEADHIHGHRRVFDPETFRECFVAADLELEIFGGYWLKPVSNAQIEATWSDAMIEAFMRLGERYPDIAAEIYVVARKASSDHVAPPDAS
jgi:2-polyprenyl-3-methyl-5-hydroxy-6-metoxy-1,4-benzoquinol methylase